jgi:hypothetical protein
MTTAINIVAAASVGFLAGVVVATFIVHLVRTIE